MAPGQVIECCLGSHQPGPCPGLIGGTMSIPSTPIHFNSKQIRRSTEYHEPRMDLTRLSTSKEPFSLSNCIFRATPNLPDPGFSHSLSLCSLQTNWPYPMAHIPYPLSHIPTAHTHVQFAGPPLIF